MKSKLMTTLTIGLLAASATACGSDPSDAAAHTVAVTGTDSDNGAELACPVDDPNCYEDGTGADAPPTTSNTTTAPGPTPVVTVTGTDGGGYGPPTVDLEMSGDRTVAISSPLADGVYFSQDYTSDGSTVTFNLTQYFQCDSSTNVPNEPTVVCASGFGTLDVPIARVELAPDAVVSVTTGDLADPTSAEVTAAEFARLVSGEPPAADAPAGYTFADSFMFVEVEGDAVVAARQFYTS